MSLDPQRIHAERYPRMAEIIRESVDEIALQWWLRSREGTSSETGDATKLVALEHVRDFVRCLAYQLASTDAAALLPQGQATELGELRWKQGEDISQVVRDCQTLRLVLIDHLDRELDAPLSCAELMVLSLNIDEAINAAVFAFSHQESQVRDEREEELERRNRELQRFAHVVAHELKSPLNVAVSGHRTAGHAT